MEGGREREKVREMERERQVERESLRARRTAGARARKAQQSSTLSSLPPLQRTHGQPNNSQRPEDLHADAGGPGQHQRIQAGRLQDGAVGGGPDGDGPPGEAQGGAPPAAGAGRPPWNGRRVVRQVGQVEAGRVRFDEGADGREEEQAGAADEGPEPEAS